MRIAKYTATACPVIPTHTTVEANQQWTCSDAILLRAHRRLCRPPAVSLCGLVRMEFKPTLERGMKDVRAVRVRKLADVQLPARGEKVIRAALNQ